MEEVVDAADAAVGANLKIKWHSWRHILFEPINEMLNTFELKYMLCCVFVALSTVQFVLRRKVFQ